MSSQVILIVEDEEAMSVSGFRDWELVFVFRLNSSRMIRIYADVLVITPSNFFSL